MQARKKYGEKMKKPKAKFNFKPFSLKQKKVFTWWREGSPHKDKDGIVCDGAIRSGKTLSMGLSFVFWAMETFNGQMFGMCGKTVGSFRRNVWVWLKIALTVLGYKIKEKRSENLIIISKKVNGVKHTNHFYIFSGKDESSQDLIQGITLAGVLFDEVALMPQNFVEQATGRCSVEGSKFWFNCNPDHPEHWFKKEWIDKRIIKNLLYFTFHLEDNLSLSRKIIQRYKSMYFGVFFKRFILGLWVIAEGAIYDMFEDDNIYEHELDPEMQYTNIVSVDYGTSNPMVFLDIYDDATTYWVEREYYYNSRETGVQKTDEQYADDFDVFCGEKKPHYVIVDPSASSFKLVLRNRGYFVKDAKNDVENGIRTVSTLFGRKLLKIHKRCYNCIGEHRGYVWAKSKEGKEQPVKDKDHCPDALRYGIFTLFNRFRLLKGA